MSADDSENATDRDAIQVWFAYPADDLSEEDTRSCIRLLFVEERRRMNLLRFDRHRKEYLFAHVLARRALSHFCPVAPEEWSFVNGPYGKPTPDPDCGLFFNLSHSAGLAVCAIAHRRNIGVDTESEERGEGILEISERVFSPLEIAQIDALPNAQKPHRAVSLWTLKEAYCKARGIGLSLPLSSISFLFGESEGIRLEFDSSLDDQTSKWQFCLLARAGHCVAIVFDRSTDPRLNTWELHPLSAAPTQLAEAQPMFFPIAQASH